MNQNIPVELTPQQKTLLLDGLSYLRSCALLETRFPSEETTLDRERQVQEIEDLAAHLDGSRPIRTTASV